MSSRLPAVLGDFMGKFAVPSQYQQRVLMVGLLMALVLRAVFIAAGAAIISTFSLGTAVHDQREHPVGPTGLCSSQERLGPSSGTVGPKSGGEQYPSQWPHPLR